MTQLTSAPQSGLAEFNPFSEVGDYVLSESCSLLGDSGMCIGGRCQGVWSKEYGRERTALESCCPHRDSPKVDLG